jgi:hypothetical protein
MRIFRRLKDHDGEIHRDIFSLALELSGVIHPKTALVSHASEAVTPYSTVDCDEFLRFILEYDRSSQTLFGEAFSRKADKFGSIGVDDAVSLCHDFLDLGLEAPGKVLKEIFAEVAGVGVTELDGQECSQALDLYNVRQGFSKEDYKEVTSMFTKLDSNGDATLQSNEVQRAVSYIGYTQITPNTISEVFEEISVGAGDLMTAMDLLVFLRKVREKETAVLFDLYEERYRWQSWAVSGGVVPCRSRHGIYG